jgi:hypothetical protein
MIIVKFYNRFPQFGRWHFYWSNLFMQPKFGRLATLLFWVWFGKHGCVSLQCHNTADRWIVNFAIWTKRRKLILLHISVSFFMIPSNNKECSVLITKQVLIVHLLIISKFTEGWRPPYSVPLVPWYGRDGTKMVHAPKPLAGCGGIPGIWQDQTGGASRWP